MSEAVETESAVETGQTSAGPERLGDGIYSDTPAGVPFEPEGNSVETEVQEEETPAPVELDSFEKSQGYLRHSDYTKKTTENSQRNTILDERERSLEIRERNLQPQESAAQPQTQPSQYSQAVSQALQSPTLTAEDRAGLQLFGNMAQDLEQTRAQLADLQARQEEFEPRFQETANSVYQLSEAQVSVRAAAIKEQVTEAQESFGEEAVTLSNDFIHRNYGATNPATGKDYTIPELVALATGKTAEEATAARERSRTSRQAAKQGIAARTSPSGGAPKSGKLSERDAVAEIAANMRG